MLTLVVADDFPWPSNYGATIRLAHAIEALATLGDIELFSLVQARRTDSVIVPPHLPVKRMTTVANSFANFSIDLRLRWLLTRGLPLELALWRTPSPLAPTFSQWAGRHYDLVFFSRPEMFVQTGSPKLGPTIVDYVDLEDQKIRAGLAADRADGAGDRASLPHRLVSTAQTQLNAARWSRLETTVGHSVQRVICCSDDDRRRLGVPGAVVVPNGFDPPARPLGKETVGNPPTILFQGSLRYRPNTDAAMRLVTEVLPLVQQQIPDGRVRLVGDPDPSVTRLDHPPSVCVVGKVPSMDPELETADLVAVPIRFGSGTRLKILEAMANRIPVVATTIAAEGLNLENSKHALICDDMPGFAQACVAVLQNESLRRRLVDAAQEHFLRHFRWEVAQKTLADLATETAAKRA